MIHRTHSRKYHEYMNSRRSGYGTNLYRNTKDRKIAGVCAGLADHFGISHWVMRILFITAFMFTGGVIFWIYIIGWIVLSPAHSERAKNNVEYDEREQCYRRKNVFRYQAPTGDRIKKARARMEEVNRRIQAMEEYVTSRKFKLDEEFSKL